MRTIGIMMLLFVVTCGSGYAATIYADSSTGFSGVQGENGWSYRLWYAPMGWSHDLPNYSEAESRWYEGDGYIWNDGMHPHSTDWYIVREWTSTVTGSITINGSANLSNPENAAGVILNIFDGYDAAQVKWSDTLDIDHSSTTHSVTFDVNAGDKILFTIIGNGAITNDATVWTLQVVPEPVTMAVLGFGGILIACKRRIARS